MKRMTIDDQMQLLFTMMGGGSIPL